MQAPFRVSLMRPYALLSSVSALALVVCLALTGHAQNPRVVDPSVVKEIEDLEQRLQKIQDKLKALKDMAAKVPQAPAAQLPTHLDKLLAWRSIGPANMGGRIT